MRYTPLLLLLLASCQRWSWEGAADALMPDELIVGHGSGQHDGVLLNHQDLPYVGESTSTSLAFSWDIPSFKSDNGMSRETQRNFSLLVDHMVAAEGLSFDDVEADEAETSTPVREFKLPTMKGRKPPSAVLWGLAAFLIAIVAVVVGKSRRKDPWS